MNTEYVVILPLCVILSYLIGSISSAVLVCKLFKLPDPRTQGSGNPGATNVLRMGGKIPGALTLLGDALKGWLPVFLSTHVSATQIVPLAAMCAAILGHLYPLFFKFQGGKGVATILGGILGFSLTLGGIFIFTWVGVFALFRYSSLAAIVACLTIPFWAFSLYGVKALLGFSALAILITWRHKTNIIRLVQGKEAKFKADKESS